MQEDAPAPGEGKAEGETPAEASLAEGIEFSMPKADVIDGETLDALAVETNDEDDVDDLRAQLEALNAG